jgi:ferritin-like metal-binding protein YciE
MKIETIKDLLISQLQDMYSAANQFDEALERLIGISPNQDTSDLLSMRRKTLSQHRDRITELSRTYEFSVDGTHCAAAEGIVRESNGLEQISTSEVRAAAIIGFLKRVIAYNAAGFSTALGLAVKLNYDESAETIRTCFEEEKRSRGELEAIVL